MKIKIVSFQLVKIILFIDGILKSEYSLIFVFKRIYFSVLRINLDRNIDVSPSKSFQGHTGPVHDLCQISIGKFHLILTASSDLSVRVCCEMNVSFSFRRRI